MVLNEGRIVRPSFFQRSSVMVRTALRIGRAIAADDGQDLLEYGLLAALIAVVAIVGVTTVGNTIYTVFWGAIGQAV
jgi:Flp pilus assembly pilin Flp